jgi:hypothetical protein
VPVLQDKQAMLFFLTSLFAVLSPLLLLRIFVFFSLEERFVCRYENVCCVFRLQRFLHAARTGVRKTSKKQYFLDIIILVLVHFLKAKADIQATISFARTKDVHCLPAFGCVSVKNKTWYFDWGPLVSEKPRQKMIH